MLASKQARALRPAAAKAACRAANARCVRVLPKSPIFAPVRSGGTVKDTRAVLVRSAAKDEVDFDKFLITLATKWEDSDNKPVVVGYSLAFLVGFFFIEWFIHLPVLDFLLGFPIQLVGVATLPYLLVRWLVGKKDWYEDVSGATGYVVSQLPYLEKKKE